MKNFKRTTDSLSIVLVFFTFATLIFTACEQKNLPLPEESDQDLPLTTWDFQVQAQDGILVFSNWDDAEKAIFNLTQMDWESVVAFYAKMGILSQAQIFHEIVDEEEAILNSLQKKYPTATTLKEAKSLGYTGHSHGGKYQEALSKGLLTIEQDDINGHVYYYSVIDPTLVPILNENGLVAIDNQLWQFTDNQIKTLDNWNPSKISLLLRANKSYDEAGITVLTKDSETVTNRSIGYDWTRCGSSDCSLWTEPQSNRRVRYKRTGWSDINNCGDIIMYVKYFTSIYAQRRTLGIWHYSNGYRPTFTFNGNWTFQYEISDDSGCCLSSCAQTNTTASLETGVITSPMVDKTFFGNNSAFAFGCHPHASGYRILSSSFHYFDPIDVNITSFTCFVDGTNLN